MPLYSKQKNTTQWKKYPIFTKAAQKFLDQFRNDMQEFDIKG